MVKPLLMTTARIGIDTWLVSPGMGLLIAKGKYPCAVSSEIFSISSSVFTRISGAKYWNANCWNAGTNPTPHVNRSIPSPPGVSLMITNVMWKHDTSVFGWLWRFRQCKLIFIILATLHITTFVIMSISNNVKLFPLVNNFFNFWTKFLQFYQN